jgi:hypothetical protein
MQVKVPVLDKNGNVTKTATATTGLPTATGTRDANGTPVINIQQDTGNSAFSRSRVSNARDYCKSQCDGISGCFHCSG